MYDEILDDPKVQRLSGDDFKAWVNLLCLASKNGGRLPPIADVAFRLRETEDAVTTLLERFLSAGLIEVRSGGANGSHHAPHSWDKRQYSSDTSTERVKRFRQRSRNGDETASETPPEPETESDTEQTPQPPADGGLGSGQKASRLASALCSIAGIDKHGEAATGHVRRWLADGITEATIVETVRGMVRHSGGATRSLKRFDAPIRRAHDEARTRPRVNGAKPHPPPVKPKAEEPVAEPDDPVDREEVRALVSGLASQLKARETASPPGGAR